MSPTPTLLKVLLTRRHWQKYETFRAEYEKTARRTSPELMNTAPSKAQYYRWLAGQLKGGVPYPDACRVLEQMFPQASAAQLFAPAPRDETMDIEQQVAAEALVPQNADVIAVYPSRAEFAARVPPANLLAGAREVRAAGISLNMICQQVPDQILHQLIEDGARFRCLFLAPQGQAIREREREEDHRPGRLSTLTELNMLMLTDRVRSRLSAQASERLQVATYDETVRFNIVLVDDKIGVIQPYLPQARGVDSPTLLVERRDDGVGLFPVFVQVFDALWGRSKAI
jgi:Domain of unknown function (DUF5919)